MWKQCKHRMADIINSIRRKIAVIKSQIAGGSTVDSTIIDELDGDARLLLTVVVVEYEKSPDELESYLDMLVEAVSDYNGLVTTCLHKINAVLRENTDIKAIVESLKERIITLENKVKRLSSDRNQLILGQVAFEIEKSIVHKVLDDLIGKNHYVNSIEDMKLAIIGEDSNYDDLLSQEQRDLADEKWKKLQKELNWQPSNFRYLKWLKQKRVAPAHPTITIAGIKDVLESSALPEHEKKPFDELFSMYKKLKPED